MGKMERLAYITRCLRKNGRIEKNRICEEFEVDERTVKRDIEYLRDRCDCHIDYDRNANAYIAPSPVDILSPARYLLFYAYMSGMARSLSLLPLVSDDIEKMANRTLDRGHRELSRAFSYNFPSTEPFDTAVLDELLDSFKTGRCCSISYEKPGAEAAERLIEPLRFINYDGQWYVLAFCHRSGGMRQFSLSRIRSARTDEKSRSMPVNDEELDAIVLGGYGIMRTSFGRAEPARAVIRFTGKSAAIVARQRWHFAQELRTGTTSGGPVTEIALPVESFDELLRRVLFFGDEAEVVEPAGFREEWLRAIRAMYNKYCGE